MCEARAEDTKDCMQDYSTLVVDNCTQDGAGLHSFLTAVLVCRAH
ncbi:hypothetical protein PI124_g23594 [Phytophthora idaei]|nr:hypothetical protein PI124_g23594 [Phytophthora idaei]